jgi:hypothetical protein
MDKMALALWTTDDLIFDRPVQKVANVTGRELILYPVLQKFLTPLVRE